jgi:hypothetical protein
MSLGLNVPSVMVLSGIAHVGKAPGWQYTSDEQVFKLYHIPQDCVPRGDVLTIDEKGDSEKQVVDTSTIEILI